MKDVVITYSTGSDYRGAGHALYSGQLHSTAGSAAEPYTDDIFVPGGTAADVKAVKIAYTSNWWVSGDYAGYATEYGLSKVRFGASTPEPARWCCWLPACSGCWPMPGENAR